MDLSSAAVDMYSAKQHMIDQHVKANAQAAAQLTLQQFDKDDRATDRNSVCIVFEEENPFYNGFGIEKAHSKPKSSKTKKPLSNTILVRKLFLIKLYPKCTFQLLMEPIQEFVRTSATIILKSTVFQKACGLQLQQCILRVMHPNGIKHTSKLTVTNWQSLCAVIEKIWC